MEQSSQQCQICRLEGGATFCIIANAVRLVVAVIVGASGQCILVCEWEQGGGARGQTPSAAVLTLHDVSLQSLWP